jgi:hypothetical protein
MNRKDRKAQSDRVARVIPLHQAKTVIARPLAAQEFFKAPLRATAPLHLRSSAFICGSKPFSRKNALLASTATFTSPLPVFASLRFNSSPAAAGHGVHRSVSPTRRAA